MKDKKTKLFLYDPLVALALVGTFGMPLPSSNPRVQAQSAIPEFSTATRTHLSASRLSTPGHTQSVPNAPLSPTGWKLGATQTLAPYVSYQTATKLPIHNSNILVQPNESRPSIQVADEKPEDRGQSPTPAGAGSRGLGCPRVEKPLTALVPVTEKPSGHGQSLTPGKTALDSILGLTVAEHPTFWLYVPYSLTSESRVEFVLKDDNGNDIYETNFTELGTRPGVVGFELPSTAPRLEVNKRYRWEFYVYCYSEEPKPPRVIGWMKRVSPSPSLKRQLEQAKPQQRGALYARAGIWHEAVTSLAELCRKNPEDVKLKEQWATLLQSMNLDAIAEEPITSVLTPEN